MEALNAKLLVIQGIITGCVVVVAIICTALVAMKNMPSIDKPDVKNQMWRGIGSIWGVAVTVAAITWAGPWLWNLFVSA